MAQGIAVFFITIICGAEVVQTHDLVKERQAHQRLSRSDPGPGEVGRESMMGRLTRTLSFRTTSGPHELAWQEANAACLFQEERGIHSARREAGCVGNSPGMCAPRPLANDKTLDESCRLTKEYMLRTRPAYFLDLQTHILVAKVDKYKESCASMLYKYGPGFLGELCVRRAQQMLYAMQFVVEAQQAEVLDQFDAAGREAMNSRYYYAVGELADMLAGDKAGIQRLASDGQKCELKNTHPTILTRRAMEVQHKLLNGTPEEKLEATAFIKDGRICEGLSDAERAEVEADQQSVEREMTAEEVAAAQREVHADLDTQVEVAVRDVQPEEGDATSLIETGHSNSQMAAKYIGSAVLGVAVGLFMFFGGWTAVLTFVGVSIGISLLTCSVNALAASMGRPQEIEAWKDYYQTNGTAGMLEINAAGSAGPVRAARVARTALVEAEAAESAVTQGGPSFATWGHCIFNRFMLPFVLVGRGLVWVVKKLGKAVGLGKDKA